MSKIEEVKPIETVGQAGEALLNTVNPDKAAEVLWFAFRNKASVGLFVIGALLLLTFMFLRMTRKL